jgi:hypothetical protein
MRTTDKIERIETYNKNAAVLPRSSVPQKANIRTRMASLSQNPRTSHTINTTRTIVPTTP